MCDIPVSVGVAVMMGAVIFLAVVMIMLFYNGKG